MIIVYYTYKYVSTSKEIETFRGTTRSERYKCIAPNLVNTNYNKEAKAESINNNIFNIKGIEHKDGTVTPTDKFISLIEKEQPFNPEVGDCVCEVKQSNNYIWFLNQKRNKIVKSLRNELRDKDPITVFENKGSDNKFITAWGVSKDERYDCCIIFVRDIDNLDTDADETKNYFIIVKSDIDSVNFADQNLHNTPSDNKYPDEIYTTKQEKLTGTEKLDFYGDIYIELDKIVPNQNIIFNVFGLNYFDENFKFGIVNTVKPTAIQLKFKREVDNSTENTEFKKLELIKYGSILDSSTTYIEFGKTYLIGDKDNEFKPVNQYIKDNFRNQYTFIPDVNIDVKSNFIDKLHLYFNGLNLELEGFKINLALSKFCFNTLIDFQIEGSELILYKTNYYTDSDTILKCKISKDNYKINFSGLENIASDIFESSSLSSESTFDLGDEIMLPGDKYLFCAKRNIDTIRDLKEKYKDVREVGHYKYHKDNEKNSDKLLSRFYNFKYISIGADNIQGVLSFNKTVYEGENSPIIKSIISKYYDVYFTLYEELEKKESKEIYYGRHPLKTIVDMTSICYPAQKFNYENNKMNKEILEIISDIDESEVNSGDPLCHKAAGFNEFYKAKLNERKKPKLNKSIFYYLMSQQSNEDETVSDNKFKNIQDWYLLYYIIRLSGLYNLEKDDKTLEKLNDNINNDNLFLSNPDKWTQKHIDIIKKGIDDNQIYTQESQVDMFPNINLFSKNGSNIGQDSLNEEEVYIHLKYELKVQGATNIEIKFSEDLTAQEPYNFLKLVPDSKRTTTGSTSINQQEIDGVIYNYFKLEQTSKLEVEQGDSALQKLHTWIKRKIHNFNEFKELVLGADDNSLNEIDPRDRIRGIYELDNIYVDDYYIDFLKSNVTNVKGKEDIIKRRQKDVNKYCFDKDTGGKKINRLGYPFVVFYKDVLPNGTPCFERGKDTQRIFLCNRVHPGNIKCEQEITKSIKGRYPLIKQDFLSFSGYGNIIQFYEKKFGGLTNIKTAALCTDPGIPLETPGSCSFIDENSKKECNKKVLSLVTLDGQAKCEIANPNVKRDEVNPIEVLVPGMVDKHICDIFILKGDKKIYFTLGKLFENIGGELGLSKEYNTIKNEEGQFLKYNKDTDSIETDYEAEKNTSEGRKVPDEFKFKKEFKTDNYGNYYLISPKGQNGRYLTSKIDLYQHTLGGGNDKMKFVLEGKKNISNRDHLNDEDYYSQKFIVNDSLFYANIPNYNEIDEKTKENIENNKKKRHLEATIYPKLAVGDNTYNPNTSDKEKQEMLKELLHNIKRYQRAKNERSSVNLEMLGTQLPKQVEETENEIPKREPIIQKQLHNLQFLVGLTDQFEESPSIYSKFEIPKIGENEKTITKKISNINKDMFTEGQIIETGNALQKIKDFVPKNITQRRPSQCKNLNEGFDNYNEGFQNMYYPENKFHNHIVDKYNTFVVKKTQNVDRQVDDIKDNLFNKMKSASEKINDIQMDGKKQQIKLSKEIADSFKLKDTIHNIKEDEQIARMDRMREKIKEIKKLKCQLGDVNYKKKVKDHPKYNSIMSREDGSFMNIYKLDKKCDKIDSENLNKNMIFINGGCLSYDEEKMRLNIEHCHVTDENQHFNIHQVNDIKGMDDLTIYHNGKDLDRPHYVITKNPPKPPQEESEGPSESIYSSDECAYNYAKFNEYNSPAESDGITCDRETQRKLCLHKEEGEISMRKCNNIRNQQWDHSDITSHCN